MKEKKGYLLYLVIVDLFNIIHICVCCFAHDRVLKHLRREEQHGDGVRALRRGREPAHLRYQQEHHQHTPCWVKAQRRTEAEECRRCQRLQTRTRPPRW